MPLCVRWPFEPGCKMSQSWRLMSKLIMATVGTGSIIMSRWANSTTVHNLETLYHAIEQRPSSQPLLTVCNHHSCFDEPVLWGMLRFKHLTWGNDVMRWPLGAADVCFTTESYAKFFAYGRTIPVCRGDGVYQKGMDFAIERLNEGAWVHAYPEGRINNKHEFIRLKWGIGRLVAECNANPIVLPFHHMGMDDMLPNVPGVKPRMFEYRPRIRQRITVFIGEPMDFSLIRNEVKNGKISYRAARKLITDRVQDEFEVLRQKTLALHRHNK